LIEVLAAMLFMAIVIPVAVEALLIANRAGEVAQRKSEAIRVAEHILNENIIATNSTGTGQSGTLVEGYREFRWALRNEPWSQLTDTPTPVQSSTPNMTPNTPSPGQTTGAQPNANQLILPNQIQMELLTVEVVYSVQSKDYSVQLSTLVSQQ
jgi:type II secretory pathway pseudopilin PulG